LAEYPTIIDSSVLLGKTPQFFDMGQVMSEVLIPPGLEFATTNNPISAIAREVF
jgi:hypothetical protein